MSAAGIKVAFRIVLVTVLFTMLGFAIGGFLGIVSVSALRATKMSLNMMDALWFGGVPGGVAGCMAGLVIISISERRARSGSRI